MGLSAYLAQKLAAQYGNGVAYSWPTTIYIALFTVQPSGGTGGTEASYTGYARVAMTIGTTDFTTASGGNFKNAIQINWPTNTGTAQTIVGYGAYDALTGGNLLSDNTVTTSQTVNNGAAPYCPVNDLSISFTISP